MNMSHFLQVIAWSLFTLVGTGSLPQANCNASSPQAKEETTATENSSTDSVLISPEQLKKVMESDSENVRLIEASTDLKKYKSGHLPGAIFVHWLDDMIKPEERESYSNLTSEQLATLMSRKGIGNQHRIIIYDRFASRLSTRLYWTLKSHGHQRIQILNGGFQAWESKYDLTKESPKYAATQFQARPPKRELLAEMDFVKSHLGDANTKFVDGRPPEQYSGAKPGKVYHTGKAHAKKGHIPTAVNVFWKDNFNKDGTFKSVPELRKLYTDAGVRPDQCVVTYCNEGLHAAPPWFVLTELLGYNDVRLYDDSMAEWGNSDSPVETKMKSGE